MILAIVLVDLPVELDSKEAVKVRERQGSSWWYLACESDDHFIDVVDEVISPPLEVVENWPVPPE